MKSDFDPLAFARDIEAAAQEGGWTTRQLPPCTSGPRPWFQRTSPGALKTPSLYISAGIHGDEYSGPFALLEMLRQPLFFAGFEVTLFPMLNPDGLARGIRENGAGIDLNRDYRNSKSMEAPGHIEALKTLGRFDAALMLHEDWEGIGAYLYELNDSLSANLGQRMIKAMSRYVPIDERPVIEEVPATNGVISRRDLVFKHGNIADRPDWPEAIYLSVNHSSVSYTTETPKPFPLADRIQAQIAAVATVLEELRKP